MSLEFNDSAEGPSGSWFADSSSSSKKSKVANEGAVQGKVGGLGYDASRRKNDGQSKPLNSSKGLSEKNKRKLNVESKKDGPDDNDNDDDDDDDELHGVVEDFEVSRTSVGSSKKVTEKGDSEGGSEKTSKKKNKNKKSKTSVAGEAPNACESTEKKEEPAAATTDGDTTTEKEKKVPKGYWGELKATPVEIVDGEVVKRKRKKTRSKQKNIRKDTRSEDKKPNYRPLTVETMTKLAQRKEKKKEE
jgi:hypothetical protein